MEKLDIFSYDLFPHKYKGRTKYSTFLGAGISILYLIFVVTMIFYTLFAPDTVVNYKWVQSAKHPISSNTPDNYQDIDVIFDGKNAQIYLGIDALVEKSPIDTNFTTIVDEAGCVSTEDFCSKDTYYTESEDIQKIHEKDYEGIYVDVKVAEMGGSGSNGYYDIFKNLKQNIYQDSNSKVTETDGEYGKQYIADTDLQNYQFKLQSNKLLFPYTPFGENKNNKTSLYGIFNDDFQIKMNGERLIYDSDRPGKDDIMILSVMADKKWLENRKFGLGFIFKLIYHSREYDTLSEENIQSNKFKTILHDIEDNQFGVDNDILVKLGDFYDVIGQYGTKQAPLKRDYIRTLSYDVESIYIDKRPCDHLLCSYRQEDYEEIKQINNLKPVSREVIGISEQSTEEWQFSKTAQQQLDYQEDPEDIQEKVTLAQYWLIPNLETELQKKNTYAVRQKLEVNFGQTIILLISVYYLLFFIVCMVNKIVFSKELQKLNAIPKDYSVKVEEDYKNQNLIASPEQMKEQINEENQLQNNIIVPSQRSSKNQITYFQKFNKQDVDVDTMADSKGFIQQILKAKPQTELHWEKTHIQNQGSSIPLVMPGFEDAQTRSVQQNQAGHQNTNQINKNRSENLLS